MSSGTPQDCTVVAFRLAFCCIQKGWNGRNRPLLVTNTTVSPSNPCADVLSPASPNATVFGDRAFKEAVNAKGGHRAGAPACSPGSCKEAKETRRASPSGETPCGDTEGQWPAANQGGGLSTGQQAHALVSDLWHLEPRDSDVNCKAPACGAPGIEAGKVPASWSTKETIYSQTRPGEACVYEAGHPLRRSQGLRVWAFFPSRRS